MPLSMAGWNEPIGLRALAGSVPSDSTFASYHKAPGSEREYAQVKHHTARLFFIVSFTYLLLGCVYVCACSSLVTCVM